MNFISIIRKSIIIIFIIVIILCSSKSSVLETKLYYGHLKIPSINMNLPFYEIDNSLNNVNNNIELIDTGIKDTYLIAGHSGTGKLAYFNDLKNVSIDDLIELYIDNNYYQYIVKKITSQKKNGKLSIPKESNWLILTTCDQINKGYQLTIWAYKNM